MMILLATMIIFARNPVIESYPVSILAKDCAMNAKLQINHAPNIYKRWWNLASMLKRYSVFKEIQQYANMNVRKHLNVVTNAKSIAQIIVMTQSFLAKNRSSNNCPAGILSKLTASRYLKMSNAIVIVHSFYLVDTNALKSVSIAKRQAIAFAIKNVLGIWFVDILAQNHALKIVLLVKLCAKRGALTINANKTAENHAFFA